MRSLSFRHDIASLVSPFVGSFADPKGGAVDKMHDQHACLRT